MKPDLGMQAIARLGQVDVREDFIEGEVGTEVHGLWESAELTGTGRPRITVNPAHSIVDTLIHEALHEIHPEWTERMVRTNTTRVMRKMSPEQVWAIYSEYRRRVAAEGDE